MIAFFVYKKVTNKEEGENTVAVQSVGAITGTANTSQNRFSGIVISRKDCKNKKRGKYRKLETRKLETKIKKLKKCM